MAKKTPKKQAVSSSSNPMIEGVKATLDTLRVTPQQYPKITNPRTDRLTDLIFVLLIFGIAFWFRLWLRVVFFDVYPDSFGFRPMEDGPLYLFNYFNVESGQEIPTEGYADFPVYYIPYVDAFVDGWDPYSGHITDDDKLNAYVYGPFYIYLISIGSYFFDMDPHDSIVYSNLLFDSLTYVMVYVLAKRVTGNVIAFTIALIGSFSPIAIYYSDLKVLNAPQMNFLLLVFLYFYLEKRDNWSMFFLAMATLTKQFPLFMLMPVGFWMARRYGILRGIAKILIFFFFALLLSLPYIVTTFVPYYQKLFLPGGPKTTIKCPEGGEATNLLAGILDLGSCDAYFASDTNASSQDLNLIEFTTSDVFGNLLFSLINSHVLFLGSLFLLAWVGFTGFDYLERNPKLYYRFTAAYMCLAHATIARGIYKYYLTLLVPLILLSLIPGNNKNSLNISIGAMIHKGWKNWIDPKNRVGPATVNYWTYFVALLISTIGVFWLIDASISMFATSDRYHRLWLLFFSILAVVFIFKPGNLSDTEADNKSISKISETNVALMIAGGILAYLALILGKLYFANDSSNNLLKSQIILAIILFSFFSLPFLDYLHSRNASIYHGVAGTMTQFSADLIYLGVAFLVSNLINIQVLTIHRYYTTSIVLAISIFLMGLLGNAVWTTYVSVPKNAILRFILITKKRMANVPRSIS